jgi:hypothetical protein
MMRHSLRTLVVLLFAASCASTRSDSGLGNAKADIIRPEVAISQLSSVPAAAEHSGGGLPIQYRLRVGNRSSEEITLKRIGVQSIGAGAYTVPPMSQSVTARVAPEAFESVDFWVPAVVEFATTLGSNGPVTLRVTLQFDSPVGQFQEVVVRQVSAAGVAGTRRD